VADAAPAPPAPSAAVADDDSDDELLAFDSGFSVDTSNQACPLDESMAADAGYVPPPRAPRCTRSRRRPKGRSSWLARPAKPTPPAP